MIEDEVYLEEIEIEEIEIEEIEIAPTIFPIKKVNYLNNKDMLKEIHKSKNTFCEYIDPKYSDYDIIVEEIASIYLEDIQEIAKKNRANRLTAVAYENVIMGIGVVTKENKPNITTYRVEPETMTVDELVFRVIDYSHIPLSPGRKKTVKTLADKHVKLNFSPFKHYVIENGIAKEVGRSHSKKGNFNMSHGAITNKLAKMCILMVDKYGQSGNWRNYTYIDEMKGQALLQLADTCLKFEEHKSSNPFSYFTTFMSNSFTRVFNLEKKNQDLRDDLLVDCGAVPSFTRQLALEQEIRYLREDAQNNLKEHE